MRGALWTLILLAGVVSMPRPVSAAWQADVRLQSGETEHVVEPGDTWAALAVRYSVTAGELQSLSGHINTARQPAIGRTIPVPASPGLTGGAIMRTPGGLLEAAAQHGLSPWQLALTNNVQSPFKPGLWRPLFVPGNTPIREMPFGVQDIRLAPAKPVPGQALALNLATGSTPESPVVTLDGETLAVSAHEDRLVAIGGTGAFAGAGEYELGVRSGQGPTWYQPWLIGDRDWIFQQLTLSGEAAEIDQAAIQTERERLDALWSAVTPEAQWTAPFTLPISNFLEISADYGARRSYNGGPYRSYHEGVDFSAYLGTPVVAPAAGTVVLAEPLYVRGGAVVVDHGLGIYTGYYHLSAVHAQAGQPVRAGDVLGEVGTTGLSTGNHLHWDLIVNGTWVDAMAWLEQDMACWILTAVGRSCDAPD